MADQSTKNTLHITASYFRGMWTRRLVHAHSIQAKREYEQICAQEGQSISSEFYLDLSTEAKEWYSWGAVGADFYAHWNFEAFCELADIDVKHCCHLEHGRGWVFISRTRDVTLRVQRMPQTVIWGEEFFEFDVHMLGCTGERTKATRLEEWWMKHCVWQKMTRGRRVLWKPNENGVHELF
ncbi:hypothetical protein VKT23_001277 [Stygiomarasmius scandens]|uniref:Uncharacterized protein n=1 Tax=Marasmiellus scandens TaxID=2682957 RepID=A0ABR1KC11_9AGAR